MTGNKSIFFKIAKSIGISTVFLLLSLVAFSQQSHKNNSKLTIPIDTAIGFNSTVLKDTTFNETFFPLMAWDYVDNMETLRNMKDCGINVIGFVPPDMLDSCRKYRMKAIVFDTSIAGNDWSKPFNADIACRNLPDIIKKVNANPAVYGYHIKDEPGANQFPALARAIEMVKKLAPGKLPYVNLLPDIGNDYNKYLEEFVTICKPVILSYDRYPLGEDGKFSPVFWKDIAEVRKVALEHNLPFWNTILTSAHWKYREVTAADLRLEIFGSLVYGAKGIAFYKFYSRSLPLLNAPDLGNFRMGPLDQFGERTLTWYRLRRINHEVHNLAPSLLKLHSDDVYHIGTIPDKNHGPTNKTLIKGFSNGGEFVVGDFTHKDGSRYVMIVNKSLTHSYVCNPQFNIKLKGVRYVSPLTGKLKPFPAPYYYLAPGQGVLLRLIQ